MVKLGHNAARELYDAKYPQPAFHSFKDEDGQPIPTVPMPGGVCSNRELDSFCRQAKTAEQVVELMRNARGQAGIHPSSGR